MAKRRERRAPVATGPFFYGIVGQGDFESEGSRKHAAS